MEPFLYYLLRASIALAIFYLFYKLFISRSTFHAINRAVLLLIVAASLALPLVSVTLPEIELFKKKEVATEMINLSAFENLTVIDELPIIAEPKAAIPWKNILLTIYTFGAIIMLLRYLTGIIRVTKIIRATRKAKMPDGSFIYISEQNIEPFSWMNYIVIAEKDFTTDNTDIIRHEKAHIQHRHSIDLLLVDSFCTLFWFNPFSWLLRKEVRNIHEFQADAEVIKDLNDFRDYQLLLVRHCVGEQKFSIANNFELNNLQKRIQMIMKTKSSNKAKWLYTSMVFACLVTVITLSIGSLKAKVPTENNTENKVMTAGTAILSDNTLYLGDTKIVNNEDNDPADFLIEIKGRGNQIVINGLKGTNFRELSFNINEGRSELVNQNGMTDKAGEDDSFLIDLKKEKNIIIAKALKGVKWTEIILHGNNDDIHGLLTQDGQVQIVGDKIVEKESNDFIIENKDKSNKLVIIGHGDLVRPLYIVNGVEVDDISEIQADNIANINVLKGKTAIDTYGEKGKNGVIIIKTREYRNDNKVETRNLDLSKRPLYIVDGVEVEDISEINPDDIANINVFKGKAATELYVKKGENGVILITTKKGNRKKPELQVGEHTVPVGNTLKTNRFSGSVDENGKMELSDKETPQLFILDGISITKEEMEALNTDDIESVTILKNKAATELYGERAKNGVILLTTKQGAAKSKSNKKDNSKMSFSGGNPKTGQKLSITITDDKIITEGVNDRTTAIFINGKLANKMHLEALNPKHIISGSLQDRSQLKDLVDKYKLEQEWIFMVNTSSK